MVLFQFLGAYKRLINISPNFDHFITTPLTSLNNTEYQINFPNPPNVPTQLSTDSKILPVDMSIIIQGPLQFRWPAQVVQEPLDTPVQRHAVLPLFPNFPLLLDLITDIVHPASEALVLVEFVHHGGDFVRSCFNRKSSLSSRLDQYQPRVRASTNIEHRAFPSRALRRGSRAERERSPEDQRDDCFRFIARDPRGERVASVPEGCAPSTRYEARLTAPRARDQDESSTDVAFRRGYLCELLAAPPRHRGDVK